MPRSISIFFGLFAAVVFLLGHLKAWSRESDRPPIRVLIVSPEQSGVLQTGGLAHATSGLAISLNTHGVYAEVLMPYYLDMEARDLRDHGERIQVLLDWHQGQAYKTSQFSVLTNVNPRNPTSFLRHETNDVNYFDNRNDGGPKTYGPSFHSGEAFGAFGKAAAEYILRNSYDLVILNDWTTGLVAYHLDQARRAGVRVPKVIFAIHNIAYQGIYPESLSRFLGLNPRDFDPWRGFEFWGNMSFLKAGLQYSDMIYTVSKQYAEEIATPRFGAGLDGLISYKKSEGKVVGILNGILDHEWDPRVARPELPWTFSSEEMSGKYEGKAALQKELGLPVRPDLPLFILTSRLAEQKGFEYLVHVIDATSSQFGIQWVISGNGDERYAQNLRELELRFPDWVRYRGFSSLLEAKLTRYGDFFVNAAWFEPSGQNQFFALKNGTIPLVSEAGGLKDSVKDGQNGISFPIEPGPDGQGYDVEKTKSSLIRAIEKALDLFRDRPRLRNMQTNGMTENHSWSSRIEQEFEKLFQQVLGPPRPLRCHAIHSGG